MSTKEINSVIERFETLNGEDKEFVAEIINKLLVENRREWIAKRAVEAERNYNTGKVKTGGIQEMLRDIEDG